MCTRCLTYWGLECRCNPICKAMGLTPVATCPADSEMLSPVGSVETGAAPEVSSRVTLEDKALEQEQEDGPQELKRMVSSRHRRHAGKVF